MERSSAGKRPHVSGHEVIVSRTKTYTIDDVLCVAKNSAKVHISPDTTAYTQRNFEAALALQDQGVYGFTTGVGSLSGHRNVQPKNLQPNILLSHASGVGKYLSKEETRAAMFGRLLNLSKGMSGVRPELLSFISDLLNKDVVPRAHSGGSVGLADLVPLAETFVPILNKGTVLFDGTEQKPYEAFAKAGITPPAELKTREGLALIAGNDVTTGIAALTVADFEDLIGKSLVASAMSMEARTTTNAAFHNVNQRNKSFVGQALAARSLADMLEGSDQISTGYVKKNSTQIQDPVAFKTIAQSTCPAIETLERLMTTVIKEINGLTDNPVLFENETLVSSGNYGNFQMAHDLDAVGPAVVTLIDASLARINDLNNPNKNEGLPEYLIENSGENSGFMIQPYTVTAVMNEVQARCVNRSMFSANVSNGTENVASNAPNAAMNARDIVEKSHDVFAIEMLMASQGIALRLQTTPDLQLGKMTQPVFESIQDALKQHEIVLPIEQDIYVREAIDVVKEVLQDEDFPTPELFKRVTSQRAYAKYEDDKRFVNEG